MSGTLEKVWLVLAVIGGLFAVLVVFAAAAWDAEEFSWDFWAWAILLGGVVMLVGVAVRQRVSRAGGDALVAFGSLGLGLMFWWIVPMVVALFLIVFGIKDAIQAKGVAPAV